MLRLYVPNDYTFKINGELIFRAFLDYYQTKICQLLLFFYFKSSFENKFPNSKMVTKDYIDFLLWVYYINIHFKSKS